MSCKEQSIMMPLNVPNFQIPSIGPAYHDSRRRSEADTGKYLNRRGSKTVDLRNYSHRETQRRCSVIPPKGTEVCPELDALPPPRRGSDVETFPSLLHILTNLTPYGFPVLSEKARFRIDESIFHETHSKICSDKSKRRCYHSIDSPIIESPVQNSETAFPPTQLPHLVYSIRHMEKSNTLRVFVSRIEDTTLRRCRVDVHLVNLGGNRKKSINVRSKLSSRESMDVNHKFSFKDVSACSIDNVDSALSFSVSSSSEKIQYESLVMLNNKGWRSGKPGKATLQQVDGKVVGEVKVLLQYRLTPENTNEMSVLVKTVDIKSKLNTISSGCMVTIKSSDSVTSSRSSTNRNCREYKLSWDTKDPDACWHFHIYRRYNILPKTLAGYFSIKPSDSVFLRSVLEPNTSVRGWYNVHI